MTWTCPNCGKVYLTADAMNRCPCSNSGRTCPSCGGLKYIAGGPGSPNQKCSRCNGTGTI